MRKSKHSEILCDYVKCTELKRIRIKTDPNTKNHLAFGHGYTGYILEEDDIGGILAIVPDLGGGTIELGPDQYEEDEVGANYTLCSLKRIALDYLDLNSEEEREIEIANLEELQSIDELENYLKAKNLDPDDILNIFKDFFKT